MLHAIESILQFSGWDDVSQQSSRRRGYGAALAALLDYLGTFSDKEETLKGQDVFKSELEAHWEDTEGNHCDDACRPRHGVSLWVSELWIRFARGKRKIQADSHWKRLQEGSLHGLGKRSGWLLKRANFF